MSKFLDSLQKQEESIRLEDVFKPGGNPTHTFVSREGQNFEGRIEQWKKAEYKILSVSGPTKSGKTVQLKRALGDQAVWIPGGSIRSEDEFWKTVCDQLDLSLESIETEMTSNATESGAGFSAGVQAGLKTLRESRTEITNIRARSPKYAATQALQSLPLVLVIDDFHYIEQEVQREVIRALKDPVFNGAKAVVISVPHRSFDAVKVEKEMTGRFLPLDFSLWSKEDLMKVASQGFDVLDCADPEDVVAERFANEAFGNPLLMQNFCLRLCRENGVSNSSEGKLMDIPENEFFIEASDEAERQAFAKIVAGPSRSGRIKRSYRDGGAGDIYELVLRAVSNTGPRLSMTYEDIRDELRNIVVDKDMPQKNEVTNILESITKICRDEIEGEPVMEYDRNLRKLYISDPYFAFFLKWNGADLTSD